MEQYQRLSEIEDALNKGSKEIVIKIEKNGKIEFSGYAVNKKFKEGLPGRKVYVKESENGYYVHVR